MWISNKAYLESTRCSIFVFSCFRPHTHVAPMCIYQVSFLLFLMNIQGWTCLCRWWNFFSSSPPPLTTETIIFVNLFENVEHNCVKYVLLEECSCCCCCQGKWNANSWRKHARKLSSPWKSYPSLPLSLTVSIYSRDVLNICKLKISIEA